MLVEIPSPPVVETEPAPPIDLHAFIACPTCRARIDETCKTASGHTTTPHGNRLVARRCRCGADVEAHRRYCDPCAKLSIQASKNEHARLRRAAARARYA